MTGIDTMIAERRIRGIIQHVLDRECNPLAPRFVSEIATGVLAIAFGTTLSSLRDGAGSRLPPDGLQSHIARGD